MAAMFENFEDLKQKMKEDGFEYLTEIKGYWKNCGFYSEVSGRAFLFGKKFGEMYIYNVGTYSGLSEVEFIEERKIRLLNGGKLDVIKTVNAKYERKGRVVGSPEVYFLFPLK